jgi:hypothetical protein
VTGGRPVLRIEGFKHSMRTEARDPGAGAALVRQNLADRYDQSASRLVGGENQYGGARFAKDIAGTSQAETNLHAVVGGAADWRGGAAVNARPCRRVASHRNAQTAGQRDGI